MNIDRRLVRWQAFECGAGIRTGRQRVDTAPAPPSPLRAIAVPNFIKTTRDGQWTDEQDKLLI